MSIKDDGGGKCQCSGCDLMRAFARLLQWHACSNLVACAHANTGPEFDMEAFASYLPQLSSLRTLSLFPRHNTLQLRTNCSYLPCVNAVLASVDAQLCVAMTIK